MEPPLEQRLHVTRDWAFKEKSGWTFRTTRMHFWKLSLAISNVFSVMPANLMFSKRM